MPDPIKYFGSYFRGKLLKHTVYAKTKWSDPWEEKKHVFCTNANWAVAPSMGSAELYYRYGPGIFPLNDVEKADWLNPFTLPTLAFLRIDFEVVELPDDERQTSDPTITTRSWYGIVGTLVDSFLGSDHNGGTEETPQYVRQGVQTLNAIGLEWLLDRQYVSRSWWFDPTEATVETVRVGYAFNQVAGKLSPNKSYEQQFTPTFQYANIFQFQEDESGIPLESWSSQDIVNYLLAFHMGRDQDDIMAMRWIMRDPENVIRTTDYPVVESNNIRIWQILNQVISRQRGIGFYIRVSNDSLAGSISADVELIPFSLTPDDIILTNEDGTSSDNRLPANTNKKRIDLTQDRTCGAVNVVNDAFSQFDAVEVIGAKAVHVFTMREGLYDNSISCYFRADWEHELWVLYSGGGQTEPNFPPEDEIAARQRWTSEYRHRPEFKDVYRRYAIEVIGRPVVVTSWTGETVFPDYDDPVANPGDVKRKVPLRDILIQTYIPLYGGFSYLNKEAERQNDYISTLEFMPPKAFARLSVPEDLGGSSGSSSAGPLYRWVDTQSLNISRDVEGEDEDKNYHCSISVRATGRPGTFELDVSGQPQHVLAAGYPFQSWDQPIGNINTASDEAGDPEFLVTVAVEADYHCRVLYFGIDADAPSDAYSLLRTRTIFAGDEYRLDFICKDTVFGVENGELLQTEEAYLIRDDRWRLKQIAEIAYLWYGSTRRSLQFKSQFLTNALELGDMVTGIIVKKDGTDYDDVEINTVVTSIKITSSIGGERVKPPEIEYRTEYGELDVISFFQG